MKTLGESLVWSLTFGLLGIVLTVFGYKVFDWLTPGIRVEHELAEKHNVAVAIVVGSIIIGIALVIASAIG